jgi:hypothetical protein
MGIERAVVAFAPLVLLCACAAEPATSDLATFLQRRETCDHLRGEVPDPPDEARMRQILLEQTAYCTGTDAQLASLKKRYRDDPAIAKQLAAFEPEIEAP